MCLNQMDLDSSAPFLCTTDIFISKGKIRTCKCDIIIPQPPGTNPS